MAECNLDKAVRRGRAHPAGVEEHITRERIASAWEGPTFSRSSPQTSLAGPFCFRRQTHTLVTPRQCSGQLDILS
jgi:hypothetical protein